MPETTKTFRVKRVRTQFSPEQLGCMEDVFSKTQYPDVNVLESLANDMDLAIEKVCTWFQNRRSKFRKENKKGHIAWMRQQFVSKPMTDKEVATVIPCTESRSAVPCLSKMPISPSSYSPVSEENAPTPGSTYLSEDVSYNPMSPVTYSNPPSTFAYPAVNSTALSCGSSPSSPPEKRPDCMYDGRDINEYQPIFYPSYDELYSFSYPLHSWIGSWSQPVELAYQNMKDRFTTTDSTIGMLYNHSYALLDSS